MRVRADTPRIIDRTKMGTNPADFTCIACGGSYFVD